MAKIEFEIMEHIGTLSKNEDSGWQKELNLISWNKRAPKFDLRDWSKDHEKMGKGITLSNDELANLKNILTEM